MPRASLPSECVLRTMDVLVTKHTEEDILKHMLSYKESAYKAIEECRKYLDPILEEYHYSNPYEHLDWSRYYEKKAKKHPSPFKRQYEKIWSYFPDGEKYSELLDILLNYRKDITTCDRVFGWSQKNNQFQQELEYEFNRDFQLLYENERELEFLDGLRFDQSKKNWDKEHQDWLADYELRMEHRKHRTRESYEAKLKDQLSDPEAYKWYGGEEGYRQNHPFVDTSESCKYCIQEAERRNERARIEEERRLKEEQERQREEEERKKYEEEQQQIRQLQKVTIPKFEPTYCECCDFTAMTKAEWSFHRASKEHIAKEKLKKTYCATCEIQCKNESDYQVHLQTQKHKKKCGELPTQFRCEKCNYETNIKRNFELHCGTKKHKEST